MRAPVELHRSGIAECPLRRVPAACPRNWTEARGHAARTAIGMGCSTDTNAAFQRRRRTMTQVHRIAVVVPLLVGTIAIVCTILIHLLPLHAVINLVRREKRLSHLGRSFRIDIGIFMRVVLYATVAHLIEVAFWAVLFMICGEFPDFGTAFYHSAVNYTSLGYGDVIMTPSWRLLGPLETANGMLLFGLTTAMIFAVMLWLIQARFEDLKD